MGVSLKCEHCRKEITVGYAGIVVRMKARNLMKEKYGKIKWSKLSREDNKKYEQELEEIRDKLIEEEIRITKAYNNPPPRCPNCEENVEWIAVSFFE